MMKQIPILTCEILIENECYPDEKMYKKASFLFSEILGVSATDDPDDCYLMFESGAEVFIKAEYDLLRKKWFEYLDMVGHFKAN